MAPFLLFGCSILSNNLELQGGITVTDEIVLQDQNGKGMALAPGNYTASLRLEKHTRKGYTKVKMILRENNTNVQKNVFILIFPRMSRFLKTAPIHSNLLLMGKATI